MDDPHGPTRVMPAATPLTPPAAWSPPDDYRFQVIQRAVGAEYDVLGAICDVADGTRSGTVFLAQRRSSSHLDALRLMHPGDFVDVVGTIGEALPSGGDLCPSCGAQIRTGVRFCGSCRTNLSTLPFLDAPNWISIAEWLELKGEAGRHQHEVLGRLDGGGIRPAAGEQNATLSFVARMASTSKIVVLLLERAPTGSSAVLSLDQTGLLVKRVESLLDRQVQPKTKAPDVVPPPAREEPKPIRTAEVKPEALVPPPPRPAFPLWVKVAILTVSAAAVIAAAAWMVSAVSNKRSDRAARAALDSIRADSIRADSIRADLAARERQRADSIQLASVVDSATLQISGGRMQANLSITVDQKRVSGTTIRLAPGTHIVSAIARGYTSATDTLDVQPGQRVTWSPRLTALAPPPVEHVVPRRVASNCADVFAREDWTGARTACEAQAAAPGGSGVAERTLGAIYERGLEVPQSYPTAASWYEKSAAHEDPIGQYRYGLLLRDGKGVKRDQSRAFELFRASATKDVVDAQFAAGDALDRGVGVGRNRTEAARWYRPAAEHGNADAQFALGMLYEKGDGVERSKDEAVRWLLKSVAQGNQRAGRELTWLGVKW